MSTPTYIAASIGFALAVVALLKFVQVTLGGRVPGLASRERLEQRLARRNERGHDRYFEEKRAIEAAIERRDLLRASNDRSSTWRRSAGLFQLALAGAVLLQWVIPADQLPSWAALLPNLLFVTLGLQMVLDPSRVTWAIGERLIGGGLAIISFLSFLHDLHKLH